MVVLQFRWLSSHLPEAGEKEISDQELAVYAEHPSFGPVSSAMEVASAGVVLEHSGSAKARLELMLLGLAVLPFLVQGSLA